MNWVGDAAANRLNTERIMKWRTPRPKVGEQACCDEIDAEGINIVLAHSLSQLKRLVEVKFIVPAGLGHGGLSAVICDQPKQV